MRFLVLDDISSQLEAGNVKTVVVASPDMQGRLYGRRLTKRHFLSLIEKGLNTCAVVLTWGQDFHLDDGYKLAGWDTGYQDLVSIPDLGTLRPYPWFEDTAFILADPYTTAGEPVEVGPRNMLKRALARCEQSGVTCTAASELEFYLFRETPKSLYEKNYVGIEPLHRELRPETVLRSSQDEWFSRIVCDHMETADVPIELVKAEYSSSQMEINLAYGEAMLSADRHVFFKNGVREIALQNGVVASFMAKWDNGQGGSGLHIHMALYDRKTGANIFAANDTDAFTGNVALNGFLGGLTHLTSDFMLFFAPNVNSYKRLQPGTFAPASVNWGEDNRTATFRIIGEGRNRRVENRIPGADANPYLVYTANLLAGLYGMEHKLEPKGGPVTGSAYEQSGLEPLPATLRLAEEKFRNSAIVRSLLGDDVVEHYANFARHSSERSERTVSDVERRLLLLDI